MKKILFGASYSVIEPLGLLHLSGLARDEGWESRIHLIKDHNFDSFFEKVKEFNPDIVGFNVYTGNHLQLAEAYKKLKIDYPSIKTIVGGPHPTYFPVESLKYSDYVVMSEGFGSLRAILNDTAKKGILPMSSIETFPHPNRKVFYNDYPEHAKSRIKSIISMTGCPYSCTYCYNSSTPADLGDNLPKEVAEALGNSMGMSGRLFPKNIRTIQAIIDEGKEIKKYWPGTKVIYFQDDVFGFDVKKDGMLEQLSKRWPSEVRIPFHAQMRWEMTIGTSGEKRLDLIRKAGGFGLTLAIEAGDYTIRKEVLDRAMPEKTMFEGMENVISRGFRVRTEQITALPYGATSIKTKINLDADIELLKLNVDLREKTSGPTMAWASTYAPYRGTKLGTYCTTHGHYVNKNEDVPDTFFEKSVLRFPKKWVGPELAATNEWLDDKELARYREQNAELRRLFNVLAFIPKGDILAKMYLDSEEPYSYKRLGQAILNHLNFVANVGTGNIRAVAILVNCDVVKRFIDRINIDIKQELIDLIPYFACIPKSEEAIKKVVKSNDGKINNKVLSTAIRHHLYDNVLYHYEE